MEENKAFDPTGIGLFGAVSVIFTADSIANLIKKFFLGHQTPYNEEDKIVMLYFNYIPIRQQKGIVQNNVQ